jgi:hypothetical protein
VRYALSPYIKQMRFVFKGLIWTGLAVYVSRNTEARSRNHFCCEKAINIKYYECVCL